MEESAAEILTGDKKTSSKVAIIILNWNGFEHTRHCIKSLKDVGSSLFQIILVDNASADNSVAKLKEEFNEPIYIENSENLGFTGGNNVGINYALQHGFEYVMLLNNDTEVGPDFLNPMIELLEQGTEVGAVQPLMYYLHDKAKVWNAGGKWKKWTGASITKLNKPIKKEPYLTDWITGCCILVRSEVIKRVGLLNESYFAYFEDVDWSMRMKDAGYSLYVVPKSVIYHEAGASSKSKNKGKEGVLSSTVHYLNAKNQLFQIRNHVKGVHKFAAWPFQMGKLLLHSTYFLIRFRRKKLYAVLRGLKDGVCSDCK